MRNSFRAAILATIVVLAPLGATATATTIPLEPAAPAEVVGSVGCGGTSDIFAYLACLLVSISGGSPNGPF